MAEKVQIGKKEPLYKAAEKINGAMDEVNTFQTQIDQLVVEGDSSVEAAQARVTEDGQTFDTLRERLNSSDSKLAQITQQSDLIVAVGDGGDYTTINEALEYLTRKVYQYRKSGLKVEVKLLSGFVMAEQVLVDGQDLSYITITSEDDVVNIDRASLTTNFGYVSEIGEETYGTSYPAFGGINHAKLPVIDVLFHMLNTGSASGRGAFYLVNNSYVHIKEHKGCTNAGSMGLALYQSSKAVAIKANFNDAGSTALQILRSSHCTFREGTAINSGYHGAYVGSASTLDALGAKFDGAGGNGVMIYGTSRVNLKGGASASNCNLSGVRIGEGSLLNLFSAGNFDNNGANGILAVGSVVIEGGGSGLSLSGNTSSGLNVSGSASINIPNAIINNNGKDGVEALQGANVNVHNATISDNVGNGVYSERGSTINSSSTIVQNNGGYGVYANRGGYINADNSTCTGNSAGKDVRVNRGSIISFYESTGELNGNPNQLYGAGIMFREA